MQTPRKLQQDRRATRGRTRTSKTADRSMGFTTRGGGRASDFDQSLGFEASSEDDREDFDDAARALLEAGFGAQPATAQRARRAEAGAAALAAQFAAAGVGARPGAAGGDRAAAGGRAGGGAGGGGGSVGRERVEEQPPRQPPLVAFARGPSLDIERQQAGGAGVPGGAGAWPPLEGAIGDGASRGGAARDGAEFSFSGSIQPQLSRKVSILAGSVTLVWPLVCWVWSPGLFQ